MESQMTFQEAAQFFTDYDRCLGFMSKLRWPDGKVTCPRCGSLHVKYLDNARAWKCYAKHPSAKFTLKTGTVFEDSPLGLDKWLPVVWLVVNCKNGVSSWEIHRHMGVTQKTAWFMLHRVRLAMQDDYSGGLIAGEVKVDETFIGGKARNMHKDRKVEMQKKGRNDGNKTIVVGILERASGKKPKRIRTSVISDRKRNTMAPEIAAHIEVGSQVHSDEWAQNWRMDDRYEHKIVNHLSEYVNGNCHTNSVENFWSLLKRGIYGTYLAVEPFHLFRYVDEQAFRFNNRKDAEGEVISDFDRFKTALSQIVGKRLTYKALTGKEAETSSEETPF
jgi:transposase-like protein